MSEVLKVHFLSSNTRTCFFYLNNTDLRDDKLDSSIKIQYGDGFKKETYGSVSVQSLPEVPTKCIGVSSLLANRLGLRENDEILITHCSADSIHALEILPKKEEDYVILLSCKSILESHLLNQVLVVAEGQTLPLYVFSNIVIDVEIGKLNSKSNYGKLEKFTEITILHPSERPRTSPLQVKQENQVLTKHISQIIEKVNVLKDERQIHNEAVLKHFCKTKSTLEYEIKPSCLVKKNIPNNILNKFIVVSKFDCESGSESHPNCGPYSFKFFAKIQKVDLVKETNDDEENDSKVAYNFVIALNESSSLYAFCPRHVMKKLKLHAGSKIRIDKVKQQLELVPNIPTNLENKSFFWRSMSDIQENVQQTIINNFKSNYRINSLVIGETGTGKTFLLKEISKKFSNEFVYCKMIQCKTLRGKKIETLQKLWTDYLRKFCCCEPSVLILDDLHALTYIDEEDEGQFNKFYSNRVVDLISSNLEEFQNRYNISVVASAISLPKLSSLISVRGPRLFQNIQVIPELNSAERDSVLRNLVQSENDVDFDQIVTSTKGYAIQDLKDLVDKAVFNCLVRDEGSSLTQADFDLVLTDTTPLILRGVKLKQNIERKWDDVGGMTEPKKILTEVFSWPSKYPKLLESCPLRLQRGVLLYGAPGTGKTLLAGALADKWGLNFISVKGPEVLSKYVGASEEGVRNLFIQAQRTQPCLLFFDEFDSLAPKRGHDSTGVTDRVVNQLLTQLDGVEALNGVWVLAASSRPDMLDPALLRPGRLDKLVYCTVPDEADRLSILKALSKNLPTEQDINLGEIAEKSEGYTGADIQAILYTAQMLAIKENKDSLEEGIELKISQTHLVAALSETKPSLSKLEKVKYERIYEKFLNSRKRNAVENYTGTQKITFA